MVLVLIVETKSKLLSTVSARHSRGSAVSALGVCVWVHVSACDSTLVGVHDCTPPCACASPEWPVFQAAWVPEGVKMWAACVSLSACWNHYIQACPSQIAVGALCLPEAPEVRYKRGVMRRVRVVNMEGKHHISSHSYHLAFKLFNPITASARGGYYEGISKWVLLR